MKFREEVFDNIIIIDLCSKEKCVNQIKDIAKNNIIIDLQYSCGTYTYNHHSFDGHSALVLVRYK